MLWSESLRIKIPVWENESLLWYWLARVITLVLSCQPLYLHCQYVRGTNPFQFKCFGGVLGYTIFTNSKPRRQRSHIHISQTCWHWWIGSQLTLKQGFCCFAYDWPFTFQYTLTELIQALDNNFILQKTSQAFRLALVYWRDRSSLQKRS